MKLAIASSLLIASASAFAPIQQSQQSLALKVADVNIEAAEAAGLESEEAPPKSIFETPDQLPGVVAPLGFWDPLNFASRADVNTMKRYREAELTHGRVGMLAVLGTLLV